MRLLPLDFRDQYFGCEIELTGINRATAAQTLADLFGTRAEHSGGGYDAYRVKDLDGKEWKIVRDGSIHPECRRRSVLIGETYKVELNSPKLEYGEMEKLQEVVRALRRAGGIVNDSCGMDNTIAALRLFLLAVHSSNTQNIKSINAETINCFSTAMSNASEICMNVRRARCRQVGAYLHWLYDHKYTDLDYSLQLPNFKRTAPQIPQVWSPEEIDKILAVIDTANPVGRRNYAIFLLLARTGLRISDVLGLKFSNINWKENCISLSQQKTGNALSLPLSKELGMAIISYLQDGRPQSSSAFIFLSHNAPFQPLGEHNNFNPEFHKYLRRAGIAIPTKRHTGVHTIRHSFATNMLRKGTPVQDVSQILGHSNISVTETYDNFRELLFACNIPHTGNGPRVHDFRHTFAVHTLEKQLLALLYDSGARVQELVDLRLKDVRLTHPPMVILTGKGRKVRQVPLMKDTCKLLDRYIRSFHSDSQSQMIPLFYNAKKQALSRYGVTYILKKYAAKASPVLEPQNISPHVLRHTKAMHLLRAGVNMIYIRDFLGHADISTTEVYARIDAEMKRKVFEEKVPNYTPNTTMPWEEDEDLLQWLTQFGKKTF